MEVEQDIKRKSEELLELNQKQEEFYDTTPKKRTTNLPTRVWKALRAPYYEIINAAGIWSDVHSAQMKWAGNLKDLKVLDLGCYSGNALSIWFAENCKEYVGVDLSTPAIEELNEKIKARGIQNAKGYAIDVLSPEFKHSGFDVVYAQGVLHHFMHFEVILSRLDELMKPGGVIISCDPLNMSPITRFVRAAYRPFQLNKDWEWPFVHSNFEKIQKYFIIESMHGFMGRTKWAVPIYYLSKNYSIKLAERFHKKDWSTAISENRDLRKCMQVIMCIRKKTAL